MKRTLCLLTIAMVALLCGPIEAGTVFSYDSQPGDFIGQGDSETLTDVDGDWTIRRNPDDGVSFVFRGVDQWSLDFADPQNDELIPGSYLNAEKYPFQSSGVPGLNVAGEGRSCSSLTSAFSNFNVTEVHYDWYGRPVLLSATLQQRCAVSTGSLLASIDHEFGVLGPVAFEQDNILVVIENRLWEFTTGGELVKAVPISQSDGTPPSSIDYARDLVVNQEGGVHISHGLVSEGAVHTFDQTAGSWRHDVFAGWQNVSTDGIARMGDFVFVTEGFSPGGIVRFDTTNNFSGLRFADTGNVYLDLTAGFDGLLYALRSTRDEIDVFDPVTLASSGSIALDRGVSCIAVNAAGEIFAPTTGASGDLHRFDSSGVSQDSLVIDMALTDIDLNREGTIALGLSSNGVVVTTEALTSFTMFEPLETTDSGISSRTHVAFVQTPPDPIFTGNGFETGDTSLWSQTFGEAAGLLEVNANAARSGSFGLEITLGGVCPFATDLVVPPGTASGAYNACETVAASSVEVVAPGADFLAGSSVTLGDDFSVGLGASFSASLDPSFEGGLAWVQDDSPDAETRYHARFDLNLDMATLEEPDVIEHFAGYSSDGTQQFRVSLKRNSSFSENRLVVAVRTNAGTYAETPPGEEILLPAGWNEIEVDWKAGAGDGRLFIYLNGAFFGGVSGLTNDATRVDDVRWGYLGGTLTMTTGSLLQDNFSSWR